MFLAAVLTAHTDAIDENQTGLTPRTEAESPPVERVGAHAELQAAQAVLANDRLVTLPSIHRARWV